MKKIDEKELHKIFNNLINNNKSAYNELYEKYYKLVYGIAFSIMKNKDDSEDITNDVFTKILNLDREKLPVSNEASWLFTVTRNECFSNLRKRKQNISIEEIYEIPANSKELQDIIDKEHYNSLISGLSEQEKTIISLKVLSNFTFSKISQIMNIPIGTVQWKYYKAINSLKISIGSLAGAIMAFVLVFARREKMKETPYANKTSNTENTVNTENSGDSNIHINNLNTESSKTEESSEATEHTNKTDSVAGAETSNITTAVVESSTDSQTNNQTQIQHLDPFTVVVTGIGIAFFVFFIIFFKKYQQKRNKKASK